MQDKYRSPLCERFPLRDINNAVELHPEADVCDVCNHPLDETFSGLKSNIYVVNQVLEAKVYSKKCPHCEKHFHFDGLSLCVLNMGRNIYCHQILRRFMYYFLTGRTTIYTEYTVLMKTFVDSGFVNIGDKISYQDFKEAWYAFLNLLDIDYQRSFECPSCGPDPDTVVMDATSVAFRKEMISWKNVFSSVSENSKPYDKINTARVKERILFSRAIRLMLMEYVKPVKRLLHDQKEKLFKLVEIENEDRSLISFLDVIFKESIKRGGRYFVSDIWRDLIKVFASPYPFCSFLPPSEDFFAFLNREFAKKECILQNDEHLQRLQTVVPVIFKLLRRMKEQFPFTEFNNCLPYFQQKVFDPFLKDMCPSEEANEDDELSFFPSLPQFRRRGSFVADKHGSKVKEDFCNKFSKGHPSLLPGVFTVFCPHGVCYGFQVMKLHESPDVPFTLLRTRFKQAPNLVIYDNACTLQVYCLNRDPTFFVETVFRVDGLHFKNHKACGPSFELKSYPQYALLNSQVV